MVRCLIMEGRSYFGRYFVQFCPVSKQGYSIRTTEHGVTVKFLF